MLSAKKTMCVCVFAKQNTLTRMQTVGKVERGSSGEDVTVWRALFFLQFAKIF